MWKQTQGGQQEGRPEVLPVLMTSDTHLQSSPPSLSRAAAVAFRVGMMNTWMTQRRNLAEATLHDEHWLSSIDHETAQYLSANAVNSLQEGTGVLQLHPLIRLLPDTIDP